MRINKNKIRLKFDEENFFRYNICHDEAGMLYLRGVAQLGLAHLPWAQGVGSSNLLAPNVEE